MQTLWKPMITSIDNWKVYRIVTCYLQVYPLSASLPVICKFARYLQVYPLSASLPVICKFTRHLQVYPLYASLPVICKFTRYMRVYPLSASLPVICKFTRYLQVYPLNASLPVICKFTRYLQVYPWRALQQNLHEKTKITSLPERFLAICSIRRAVSLQFVIDSPLLHFEYLTFTE